MADHLISYDLLGFKVTPTTKEQLLNFIADSIENGEQRIIASQNLHGVYMYFKDEKFRSLHDRAFVHIDGMPIIWLGKLAGLKLRTDQRTGWIDWFMPLMERAAHNGWRVFYVGGEPQVLGRGLEYVGENCPDIRIAGHHGYFDARPGSQENRAAVEAINDFSPHLLIVGMGMGRQESWILDNLDALNVNCIGTAGACIEYFAGAASIPPRWLGQVGLEWVYRLFSNPRRFWWRYLIEPWLTAWLLLRNQLHQRIGVWRRK